MMLLELEQHGKRVCVCVGERERETDYVSAFWSHLWARHVERNSLTFFVADCVSLLLLLLQSLLLLLPLLLLLLLLFSLLCMFFCIVSVVVTRLLLL